MASEDRSLSEFPRALQVAEQALVMISNPDGLGGYDTNGALLTEVGRAILAVQYTQQLGNVSVFDAIKNTRVLSGTTTPTANEGANGQLYVKYETVSNVDTVIGMYFKKDGAWLEISLGGGGNTDYIECTQAQYDAWEQGGTLDPDTLYFITDGNIGNDIIDDSTASETTVYSSDKVEDLLSDKQDKSDNSLATASKTVVGAINELDTDISNVQTVLGGFKLGSRLIESNSAIQTPLYSSLLLGWVGRTVAVEFIASWSDVQYIKAQNGISVTKLSDNRIQINNQSGSTVIAFYIYN